jgi:hypothetical protein
MNSEYQFAYYGPEHKEQVLSVLEYLWRYERSKFAEFFAWKYECNPYIESVLGIVALYHGKVVGFRGYFANRFVINGCSDKIIILHPGDTCVHPEHRCKGLSVSMGKLALGYDNKRYPLFMNMTCGAESLPGYIKMGFYPLEQKVMLNKWCLNPSRLWKNRQTEDQRIPFDDAQIQFGRFGDIIVSRTPLPEQMASVVEQQGYPENKLCCYQDHSFFKWRYSNFTHKYIFYFLMKGETVIGYVVVDVSKNNQRATIIDYAQVIDGAIKTIIENIIKSKTFVKLSILSYGLNEQLFQVFSDLGFTFHSFWNKIIQRKGSAQKTTFPLLIRPIKEIVSEQDFIIYGLNTLDFNNWLLKPICSDSA